MCLQSNEVKNATWCELVGLQRAVAFLKENELAVASLTTDRHKQVTKFVREKMKDTKHFYDIWHVAKGKYRIFI